ncbi:MAG: alanine dehydrogenase [Candidatus Spechtbacteria bacterium]|nr:alanine dehydrogenase [Candidatus Spechtbacteria bacterium]
MRIGCDRETMEGEGRVALTPQDAEKLVLAGVQVLIADSAGVKSGFPDEQYSQARASLLSRDLVWTLSDVVLKVKQPLPEDIERLGCGKIVMCFGHLAANLPLLDILLDTRVTLIDYGTIQDKRGTHILAAMSKIAGKIAFFDGAKLLMRHRGIRIGPESTVTIIGLGNAGSAAADLVAKANPKMLYLFDMDPRKFDPLRYLYQRLSPYNLWFVRHDSDNPDHQQQLASILAKTDLLIGAAHIPGEKQAKIISEQMIQDMRPGSVVMDVSIDQGGCFTTSHATSLRKPTFQKHGIVHYCVPNMPGMVPRESTPALCQETFPYIRKIAEKGFEQAVRENPALASGVNTHKGWITHEGLARSIGRLKDYKPLEAILR